MGSAAAPAGTLPWAASCLAAYRPRNPRASSLYQLLDTHFETLKRLWEERFECRYGFWQAYWDSAVFSYLDCGLFESGLARVVCTECRYEFLVAFSCKGRGLCPSCGAKRAAIFSVLLQNRILADVPHAQWVFTLPKMLRLYFLYHRELLGELARLAYETVREMMAAAVEQADARPGMVAVIQTFGSSLKVNLSRLRYHRDSQLFFYEPKAGQQVDDQVLVDPLEFLARVLIHIPEPKKHLVHFFGAYANLLRPSYRAEEAGQSAPVNDDSPPRRTLSKRWRELIYRIYEVDPLNCPRCGARMKILAFIFVPKVIRRILDHLDSGSQKRAPPGSNSSH